MTPSGHPLGGSPASVVRDIDEELSRLRSYEQAIAAERELLLAARTVLTGTAAPASRRRVSQAEVAAYLAEHPGSWPGEIAQALLAPATNISTHLYRGRHTRYERRDDGWHLRSRQS
jgi:hypothetical protein